MGDSGDSRVAVSRLGRLDFLDAVRGIASLVVVVHHTLQSAIGGYGEWSHHNIDLGRLGVVAFFVVSGYVVALTLSKQTPRVFLIRRFWRLYPIYWIATALWVVVWLGTGHEMTEDLTLLVIGVNLTMLQGFLGFASILGVAWTLGIEVAFYLQSAVSKVLGRLNLTLWAGLVWLGLFAALAGANWLAEAGYSAVMPLMMFTASLGFAVFKWDTERNPAVFVLLGAAIFIVPILSIALGVSSELPGVWPASGFSWSFLGGLALFAVFYFAKAWTAPRWVLWLGSVSYSLYLVHTTVIQLVGATALWNFAPLAVMLVLAGSLLVAGALYRFVERPFTEIGRKISRERVPA